MFEDLKMAEIKGMAFIISPLLRHNVFNTPRLLNEWSGDEFKKGILKAIKGHLGAVGGSNPISPAFSILQVII